MRASVRSPSADSGRPETSLRRTNGPSCGGGRAIPCDTEAASAIVRELHTRHAGRVRPATTMVPGGGRGCSRSSSGATNRLPSLPRARHPASCLHAFDHDAWNETAHTQVRWAHTRYPQLQISNSERIQPWRAAWTWKRMRRKRKSQSKQAEPRKPKRATSSKKQLEHGGVWLCIFQYTQKCSRGPDIDLTALVPQLDTVASDLVAHQRDTLTQRKELAQKTKDFRKLDDESKLSDIKALLKCTLPAATQPRPR
jgi:hypothetical protein